MGLSVLLYPAVHDYFLATMFSNGVRVSRSACTSRCHDPEFLLNQSKECSPHKSVVTYSKVWRVWDLLVFTTRLLPLCEPLFRAQNVTIGKLCLKAVAYKIQSVHEDVVCIYDMTPYGALLSHSYFHVQRILQSQKYINKNIKIQNKSKYFFLRLYNFLGPWHIYGTHSKAWWSQKGFCSMRWEGMELKLWKCLLRI
jgi:hypothetical protein